MQLAVIESPHNPFALAQYIDGKYFAIKELPTLTSALSIPLAQLKAILDQPLGSEISGRELPPLAPESESFLLPQEIVKRLNIVNAVNMNNETRIVFM